MRTPKTKDNTVEMAIEKKLSHSVMDKKMQKVAIMLAISGQITIL